MLVGVPSKADEPSGEHESPLLYWKEPNSRLLDCRKCHDLYNSSKNLHSLLRYLCDKVRGVKRQHGIERQVVHDCLAERKANREV